MENKQSIPARIFGFIRKIPAYVGIFLIRGYQIVISPVFPSSCRHIPTCSDYGLIAVRRYGLIRGSWLTLKRILRCRPGGTFGYDPVPDHFSWMKTER